MMLPIEASPAPRLLAGLKALGFAQQIANEFAQAPLNRTDPPLEFALRPKPMLVAPMFDEAVAVRDAPVWKCIIPLRDHPFATWPRAPCKPLPKGCWTVNAIARMSVWSKLTRP